MKKDLIANVRFSNGLALDFYLAKTDEAHSSTGNRIPQRTFAKLTAIDSDGDTHNVMNYVGSDPTHTYNTAVSSALSRVISFCNNLQHIFFIKDGIRRTYDVNISDSSTAQKCKKSYFKAQEDKYKRDIEFAKNRLADIKVKKTETTIHFN